MKKKKFAAEAFALEHETFIVYVISLNSSIASFSSILLDTNVHLFRRPQIVDLIAKKASTKVLNKYVNFADIFFLDLASKLRKHTKINDYVIKLVNGPQPPY